MIIRYKLAEPVAYEVTTATGKKIVKKAPVQEVALAPGHDTDPKNDFRSFTARLKNEHKAAIDRNLAAAGDHPMVIFRHPEHPHFVHVLHPSSKTPGHTQVTVFVRHEGKWTPHGDFQSSSREVAIRSMSGEHTAEHGIPYGSTGWKAAPFSPGKDKMEGLNEEEAVIHTINSSMLSHDNEDGSHCAHTKTRITHGNAFAVVYHHPCQKAIHVDLMKAHKHLPLGATKVADDDPDATEINHPKNSRSAAIVMRHIHKLAKHYGAEIDSDPMHPVTAKAMKKYGAPMPAGYYDEGLEEAEATVKINTEFEDYNHTKKNGDECVHHIYKITHGHAYAEVSHHPCDKTLYVEIMKAHKALHVGADSVPPNHPKAAEANHPDNKRSVAIVGRHIIKLAKQLKARILSDPAHPVTYKAQQKYRMAGFKKSVKESQKIKGFRPLREAVQPVFEELDHYTKQLVNTWKTPDHSHTDHIFGGPQRTHHTISIPIDHSTTPKAAPEHVVKHLQDHGFEVHDYAKGLARKKGDQRPIRIGRVLERTKAPEHVKKAYTNDTSREAVKSSSEHHIVISRHPHMVAGMSTGQSWRSCMDIDGAYDGKDGDDSDNLDRVKREHHAGTHVAYLAHKSDPEARRPLARIALRPHISNEGHTVLRPEGEHYGSAGPEFHDTLKKWSEHHMPYKQGQIYTKHPKVYDDDNTGGEHKFAGTMHPWIDHPDADKREQAASYSREPATLHKMAHDKDPYVRKAVAFNRHTEAATLHHLSSDPEPGVRMHVADHEKTPTHIVDKLMKDSHLQVKEAATGNWKASSEALAHEAKTATGPTLRNIAKHRNVTPDTLHYIATTKDHTESLEHVAEHAKTRPDTLHHLVTKTSPAMRQHLMASVAGNPNTHPDTLHHIVTQGGVDGRVISAAAGRKDARPDTLHHIATQPNTGYSHWNVSKHPNATSETLHHLALNNHEQGTHTNIVQHPNTSDDTLRHMSNPENGYGHNMVNVPGSSVREPKKTVSYSQYTMKHAEDRLTQSHATQRLRDLAAHKGAQTESLKPTTIKKFKRTSR